MNDARRPRLHAAAGLIVLAFIAFISLGLPDGLLGVAWPSIRDGFGLPLDALGALLIAVNAGYLVSSFGSGYAISRLGVGRLLAVSCAATGLGLIGYTLVPAWWMMVALGLLAGLGAGAIDGGLNTFVAAHFGERLMQWLHASWGVGITLGPFIMTLGLERFQSWRWGYVAVGASQIALGAYFAITASRWQSPTRPPSPDETITPQGPQPIHEPAASFAETLANPRVWMSLTLFLVYTGIEATLGYWTYTLLTESRGISAHTAGFWTGGYWATFTVGRILAGLFSRRLGGDALIRTCLVGSAVGSAILAWNPSPGSSLAGVVILGFAIAPVFPGLVSGTRARVGRRHEANTIGMQIGIAGLGAALVPALAGMLARRTSIEVIPVFLLVLSLCVLALHAVGASAVPEGGGGRMR
jgi:fucose permease